MKKTIGFVGLGLMGGWLVKHLLNAHYTVHVFDIDQTKVDALLAYGAIPEKSIKDLPSKVDVLVLSLPSSKIVLDVVQQMHLLESPKEGLIVLDTSTADPSISTELAQSLLEKGIYFMDATVSGTSEMRKTPSLWWVAQKKFIKVVKIFLRAWVANLFIWERVALVLPSNSLSISY